MICPTAPTGRQQHHVTDYVAATRIVIKKTASNRSLKPLIDAGLVNSKGGTPDGSPAWDGILQVDKTVLTAALEIDPLGRYMIYGHATGEIIRHNLFGGNKPKAASRPERRAVRRAAAHHQRRAAVAGQRGGP